MKKVTGIGGIFFKARDPEALRAWYRQHLGIECNEDGAADFVWQILMRCSTNFAKLESRSTSAWNNMNMAASPG